MSFVSGFGRIGPPLSLPRTAAADRDGQRPPHPPRRAKERGEEEAFAQDGTSEAAQKPEPVPNSAEAHLLRFGIYPQAQNQNRAGAYMDVATARMRIAQIMRAVDEASRISGIPRPAPGLTGEILGPEDAGGDDAQVIATGPDAPPEKR
ncbi:MAG: hypothetical protein WAO78_19135 [Roseovarius sp.]